MQNDWPTQIYDLQTATEIINKHVELNDGAKLGMLEIVIDKSKTRPIEIKIPEWILEILSCFREQYGYEHGDAIASKIITSFLLKDKTIH